MFGYDSIDEFIAEGVLIRYKRSEDRNRFIKALQNYGKVDSFEVDLFDKSGAVISALMCGTLNEGRISGVLIA